MPIQPASKKIMIVEDESVISLDIKNSLTKLGYTVSGVAVSGDIALRKIENNRPDLILMDIHLKGEMTGIDVAEKVQSSFQIPVVYLTANADNGTFKEAIHTGPYGYLLKPFEEKELGMAIEVALHKHQKEQVVKSSESWYATAFQSLTEAIVATDLHGDVVFMNAYAESITGWQLADAIDRPITSVLSFQRKIQQFDRIALKESVGSILGAVLRGKLAVPFPHGVQLATKSSEATPIEGSAIALRDTSGTLIGSLFLFREKDSSSSAHREKTATSSLKEIERRSDAKTPRSNSDSVVNEKDVELVEKLIRAFTDNLPFSASTTGLIANALNGSATLSSRKEGSILSVKTVNNQPTIIVKQDSVYWEIVSHVLIENGFFPVGRRTNGTCHYRQCEIPDGCQVYRTKATEFWAAWHGRTRPHQPNEGRDRLNLHREGIVVFRRGAWYRIQQAVASKDSLRIKTVGGELFVRLDDSLIWGACS